MHMFDIIAFVFSTGVTVNCLSQLVEVMEIMIETLGGESSLIIMEGLNPLLLAQKVPINLPDLIT